MSRADLLGPVEVEGGLHSPDEAMLLSFLAEGVRPGEAIVEVGSWTGVSAIRLAAGAERGAQMTGHRPSVVCVDPWRDSRYPEALDAFVERMDRYEWPVVALRGTSAEVARLWVQGIGLLWIDGDHRRQSVLADYEAWHRFVVPGGWLLLHDYLGDTLAPDTDVAAVVEEVIVPSGLWDVRDVIYKTWFARRLP